MDAETWLVDGPKVIDVEGVRRLKVALLGGQVDVVGHDEPGARVEVHSVRGPALLVRFEDGVLEVDHPQVKWDDWLETFRNFSATAAADVSIMVPRAVALKLGAVGASALVSGLASGGSVSTINGSLVVDGVQGELQVNTVKGEITVRGHSGRLSAKTMSGDMTVAGEIRSFAADSVSGDVLADLTGGVEAVRVNTVSGAVTVRLDSELGTTYSINTVSGRMQLDDLPVSGLRGRYTAESAGRGEQRVDVRINTVSGAVGVLHAVRA